MTSIVLRLLKAPSSVKIDQIARVQLTYLSICVPTAYLISLGINLLSTFPFLASVLRTLPSWVPWVVVATYIFPALFGWIASGLGLCLATLNRVHLRMAVVIAGLVLLCHFSLQIASAVVGIPLSWLPFDASLIQAVIGAIFVIWSLRIFWVILRGPLELTRAKAAAALLASIIAFEAAHAPPTLAIFWVLRNYVMQARFIPSSAMSPTLLEGDRVLINITRLGDGPKRGEIWVFYLPSDERIDPTDLSYTFGLADDHAMIKRVLGLPGDTVEVVAGIGLFVNGKLVDEWPLLNPPGDSFGPMKVPDRHLFVIGDNVNESSDSRFWGMLPIENLLGRADAIFWPHSRATVLVHH